MSSLQQFSRRMVLRGASIADNADALVRKVALTCDQAVVSATPVDTGRARSNWIAQLGSASNAIRPPDVSAALAQDAQTINSYKGGVPLHLTNNLPYIEALNDGWSAQAPAAFVETAVLQGIHVAAQGRIVSDEPRG